jgi:hypothetical protein
MVCYPVGGAWRRGESYIAIDVIRNYGFSPTWAGSAEIIRGRDKDSDVRRQIIREA